MTPTLDFETASEAGFVWQEPNEKYPLGRWIAPPGADKPGLSAVGSAAYAEHPSTRVLTCSYDLCDGRGIRRWRPGTPNPQDLFDHLARGGLLESHKAIFEFFIWKGPCVRLYGWPPLDYRQQRCSMAQALVAQYPAALDNLSTVLDLTEKKDKRGKQLIERFSIPQQPIVGLVDKKTGAVKRADVPARWIHPEDDPEQFEEFCAYCDQDVRAEMEASSRMPPMEPAEVEAWLFTHAMNIRGLGVDREGLRSCMVILDAVLDQYGRECREMTGFEITQLEKLKGWLGAYGCHTNSLDAETLPVLLARDDLQAPARRVLELRALTGSASVKKTRAIENQCSADDRLRDVIVHHGTRPGRPTGEGPQPLNLPKAGPKLVWCAACQKPAIAQPHCPWCGALGRGDRRAEWSVDMVDDVLEIMSFGSLAMVERFFGDAMMAIQGCVRPLFVAHARRRLVVTDYSSIQAVVAAELAGEQWRIDAFTRKDPIYLLGASKITGTSVEQYLAYKEQHGSHHPDRQKIGKVSELACGFQGWINSYKAFGSTEPDDVIKAQILAWRKASPAIVEAWGGQWRGPPWRRERRELFGMEGHFIAAVQNPGERYVWRGISFCMEEPECLVVRTLAGRPLRYREPILTPSARNSDELSISYMTWNTNVNYGARGWIRMPTWGGRLFENIVMAVEVDIQRDGAERLAAHGYDMILSPYDENICDIPADKPLTLGLLPIEGLCPYVQEIEHLMGIMPGFAHHADGTPWPIRATGGFSGRRYRKMD